MSLTKLLLSTVIKSKKETTITVPKLPDYVKVNDIYEPVERLTDKEIKELTQLWSKGLLEKARIRRDKK